MNVVTLFLLIVTSTSLVAQTKFIAHKSHSGTSETFTLASPGNFGLCPEYRMLPDTTSRVDSTLMKPSTTLKTSPVILPAPPSPTQIDTLKEGVPEIDSLQPNISNKNKPQGEKNVDQAESSSTKKKDKNGLLWLALGLGFPAIGITLVRLRGKKDRI